MLDFLPAFLVDLAIYLLFFTLQHVLAGRLGAGVESETPLALFSALYQASYVAVTIALGHVADRPGWRKKSMAFGLLVVAIVPLCAMAGALELGNAAFFLMIGIAGGGSAFFWPAQQARLGDRSSEAELPSVLRRFNVGWTAGKAFGLLFGGVLFRFGPSWALGAAAAATLGALGLGFLDRAPEVAREAKATLSQQRHKRGFLVAALFTNFALWGLGNTVIALVPVLGAELSMGESLQGALLFGLVGAQSGIFVVLGERKDLTYKAIPLIGVSVLGALAALALDLAPNIPIAVVASLGVGALGGAAYAFSIFYSLDYDERRGLRMSVNEAVLGLGGMLPLAGSRLAHVASAPRLPYLFAGGVCVACGLVAVSCLWTRPE